MTRAGVVVVCGGSGVLAWRVLVLAGLPPMAHVGQVHAVRIRAGWSIANNEPAQRLVDQSLGGSITLVAMALVAGVIVGFAASWLRSVVAGGQSEGGAGRVAGAVGWLAGGLWTPPVPLAMATVVFVVVMPRGSGGQAAVLVVTLGGVVALLVGAASGSRWCRRAWLAGLAAGLAAAGRSLTVLAGALVVGETLVNRPGVGALLVRAMATRDSYVVADAVTVLLVIAVIGQVVAALVGVWLDHLEPAAPPTPAPSYAIPASAPAAPRRSVLGTVLGIAALASLVLPVLLLAVSLTAGDTNRIDIAHAGSGPSAAHPLGTDGLGRDLLARLLTGCQHTILPALGAALLAAVVGVVWGGLAVLLARRLPGAGGPLAEVLLAPARLIAVPPLLIAGVILIGAGRWPVIIALAVILAARVAPAIAELDRPTPAPLSHLARAAGGTALTSVGIGISVLVGLDFLALGTSPPTPTLGGALTDALQLVSVSGHVVVLTAVLTLVACLPWLASGVALTHSRPRRAEATGTLET